MSRENWTFLLKNARFPGGLIIAWLVLSAMQVILGSPGGFQRAGAFGVGLLIIGFSALRSRERAFRQSASDELIRTLYGAIRTNRVAPVKVSQLTDHIAQGHDVEKRMQSIAEIESDYAAMDDCIDVCQSQIDQSETRLRLAGKFEILFLAAATFQWGYGDLFFCWTSGQGWRAC